MDKLIKKPKGVAFKETNFDSMSQHVDGASDSYDESIKKCLLRILTGS